MVFFLVQPPRPHFLGRALIWPGCFGEHILGLTGLYPSSFSKSVGFVSLFGKASLVSISATILVLRSWHVYFPLEFEFRGKVVLNESMSAKIASRVSYLIYYYCL